MSSANLIRRQVDELLSKGESQEVVPIVKTALESSPEDLQLRFQLTKALLLQGQEALLQAMQSAREAAHLLATQPKDTSLEIKIHIMLGGILGYAARSSSTPLYDRSSCRQQCQQAFERAEKAAGSGDAMASYNLALSIAQNNVFQQTEALNHVNNALEVSVAGLPTATGPCIALLALLLSARGGNTEALVAIDAALEEAKPPQAVEVLLLRIKAAVLLANKDAKAALEVLSQARQKARAAAPPGPQLAASKLDAPHGLEAQVWQQMAQVYLWQGSPSDAQYCVERMAKLAPGSADVLHMAGRVLQASGQNPLAIQVFERALALEPNHSGALLSLGSLFATSQNLGAARALLKQCLVAEPQNVEGWYQLGMVCRSQGNVEEAQKHLHTAAGLSAYAPVLPFSSLPYMLP